MDNELLQNTIHDNENMMFEMILIIEDDGLLLEHPLEQR